MFYRMKEMEDNNLFGSDATEASPSPQITEISLRDITQAVDLSEFKRQNREDIGDLSSIFTYLKESNVDDNNWSTSPASPGNETTDKPPTFSLEVDSNNFSLIDVSSGENLISTGSTPTAETPQIQISDQPSINSAADFNDDFTYAKGLLNHKSVDNREQTCLDLFQESDNDSKRKKELNFALDTDCVTPNGDLRSRNHKTFQNQLFSTSSDSRNEFGGNTEGPLVRHFSMQKSNKDSRTYHPRKRQSVYGNNKPSGGRNFNVEKFSKEELLLMWKSSELDLNQKLEAAKKDKEKLESKLACLQLHMSTPV